MTEDQFAADYPDAWRPEAGDKIKGTVASIKMGPDFGYGPYPIMTLNTPEGERAVHAMHQILRSELAERRVKRGHEVEITYLGRRPPKSGNGNPFHVYRVEGGDEPEFNWGVDSPSPEPEPQTGPPIQPAAPQAAPAASDDSDLPF